MIKSKHAYRKTESTIKSTIPTYRQLMESAKKEIKESIKEGYFIGYVFVNYDGIKKETIEKIIKKLQSYGYIVNYPAGTNGYYIKIEWRKQRR